MSSIQFLELIVAILSFLVGGLSWLVAVMFKRLEKKIHFIESSLLFTMAAIAPFVKRVGKKNANSKID